MIKSKACKIFDIIIEVGWLLIFGFSPIFFVPIVYAVWQISEYFLFQVLVEIILFVWLLKTIVAWDRWNIGTLKRVILKIKPVLPAFIFIFILGLSTLFSQSSYYSFWGYYSRKMGYLIWLHFFAFFLILFFNIKNKKQIARILYIIVTTTGVVVVYGFLQIFGLDILPWSEPPSLGYRVFSTFGQPNFLASWLLLAIPIVLWIIFRYSFRSHLVLPFFSTFQNKIKKGSLLKKEQRIKEYSEKFISQLKRSTVLVFKQFFIRPIFLCLFLSAIIILILTQSRGAWVGFFLSFFFFVIIFAWLKKQRRLATLLFVFLVLFSLLVTVLNLYAPPLNVEGSPLMAKIRTMSHLAEQGRLRFIWWQNSLDLIKQRPILGYGLETQHLNFVRYYQPEFGALEAINKTPDRAHNDILDTVLTSGLLGLISYLFLIISVFYLGLKYIFKKSQVPNPQVPKYPSTQLMVLVLLAGLIGYLVSLQFSFHVIPTTIYFWGYLAILLKVLELGFIDYDFENK